MKRSKFTDEQICFAPRMVDTGTKVSEVCRKMGISDATVLRFPFVVGRWADAVFATHILHGETGVGFAQDRYDLGLGELGLLHRNLLARLCQKALLLKRRVLGKLTE